MTEKKQTDDPKDTPREPFNFMNCNNVEVSLTYETYEEPVKLKFFLRLLLTDEQNEARQKHFARSEDDKRSKDHTYRVNLLAELATDDPIGFVGYQRSPSQSVKDGIKRLLGNETNPWAVKVARDAVNMYFTITEPKELFFRR